MVTLKTVQPSRISARPAHPAIAAGSAASRRHWVVVRATRPPTANSHARVGSEKNATEGTIGVASSDAANDRTATSARART